MTLPVEVGYRDDFVNSFNQTVTLLADRCLEESIDSGGSKVFDIADLGGDLGERGVDGNLPRLTSDDNQVPVILKEYGGTMRITNFEGFISQSNERAKMNKKIMTRTNRRYDKSLISELAKTTNTGPNGYNGGAAIALTSDVISDIVADLAQLEVDITPEDVTLVCTPKAAKQLKQSEQYASRDYVDARVWTQDELTWSDKRKMRVFSDVAVQTSTLLPGMGTNAAKMYIFHRNAVGCCKPTGQFGYTAGYNDEHHYHYCSTTIPTAYKILQEKGVYEITHDDTA